MTEISLHYEPQLLKEWRLGRLHNVWYQRYKSTFCERDLSNASRQCRSGYHFGEWFVARYFVAKGFSVLPPKYLHRTRPEARAKALKILGEAGVAFLTRRIKVDSRKAPRPDLLVYRGTTFFFGEVKRDTDRLSKTQSLFFPEIEKKLRCVVKIVNLKPRKP